jgi:hypothetical protein
VALFWEVLLLVGPEDSKQPVKESAAERAVKDFRRCIGELLCSMRTIVFPTTSDPNRVPEEAGRAEEAKRSGWRD